MLGSSGAGKSTLTNTLLGEQRQLTAQIREDDSKGRHTTTARSLIPMAGGAMLLDTPGMRELQLVDAWKPVSPRHFPILRHSPVSAGLMTVVMILNRGVQCRPPLLAKRSQPGA